MILKKRSKTDIFKILSIIKNISLDDACAIDRYLEVQRNNILQALVHTKSFVENPAFLAKEEACINLETTKRENLTDDIDRELRFQTNFIQTSWSKVFEKARKLGVPVRKKTKHPNDTDFKILKKKVDKQLETVVTNQKLLLEKFHSLVAEVNALDKGAETLLEKTTKTHIVPTPKLPSIEAQHPKVVYQNVQHVVEPLQSRKITPEPPQPKILQPLIALNKTQPAVAIKELTLAERLAANCSSGSSSCSEYVINPIQLNPPDNDSVHTQFENSFDTCRLNPMKRRFSGGNYEVKKCSKTVPDFYGNSTQSSSAYQNIGIVEKIINFRRKLVKISFSTVFMLPSSHSPPLTHAPLSATPPSQQIPPTPAPSIYHYHGERRQFSISENEKNMSQQKIEFQRYQPHAQTKLVSHDILSQNHDNSKTDTDFRAIIQNVQKQRNRTISSAYLKQDQIDILNQLSNEQLQKVARGELVVKCNGGPNFNAALIDQQQVNELQNGSLKVVTAGQPIVNINNITVTPDNSFQTQNINFVNGQLQGINKLNNGLKPPVMSKQDLEHRVTQIQNIL